jgi:hypothetical protein
LNVSKPLNKKLAKGEAVLNIALSEDWNLFFLQIGTANVFTRISIPEFSA